MRILSLALLAAVSGGCSQSLGSLSSVSVSAVAAAPPPAGPRVRGKSCASSVLGLPIGAPNLETAARAAQRARGSAADLQDVRVSRSSWTIGVYGEECLIVEAAR